MAEDADVGLGDITGGEPLAVEANVVVNEAGLFDPEGWVLGGRAADADDGVGGFVNPDFAPKEEGVVAAGLGGEDESLAPVFDNGVFEAEGVVLTGDVGARLDVFVVGFGLGVEHTLEDELLDGCRSLDRNDAELAGAGGIGEGFDLHLGLEV